MHRILYRLIAALARLAVRTGHSKDLEIIVLRHQLGVLRRQTNRPALNEARDSVARLSSTFASVPSLELLQLIAGHALGNGCPAVVVRSL